MRDEHFGEKYNHLTIQEFSHKDKHGNKCYHVLCDCGNDTKVMPYYKVKAGTNTTCGCRIGRKTSKRKSFLSQRFGKLVVIADNLERFVKCQCDCGNIVDVDRQRLTRKTDPKVNCGKCEKPKFKPRYKDLTGQVFGRLTVLELDHLDRSAYWKCRCECGNEVEVLGRLLRNGTT